MKLSKILEQEQANKCYPTIELAIKVAVEKTGALRVSLATDGANLVLRGFAMYGVNVFNIYKSYVNSSTPVFRIRYVNFD